MGKFDGILLCTDLDDTLLTTDKRVSDENSKGRTFHICNGTCAARRKVNAKLRSPKCTYGLL